MKLKNIDWYSVVGFSIAVMGVGVLLAVIVFLAAHQPKPTNQQATKTNEQILTNLLIERYNKLNKRVDILEQRQDGMLPLPTKEER